MNLNLIMLIGFNSSELSDKEFNKLQSDTATTNCQFYANPTEMFFGIRIWENDDISLIYNNNNYNFIEWSYQDFNLIYKAKLLELKNYLIKQLNNCELFNKIKIIFFYED